jgi:hypothetical protein
MLEEVSACHNESNESSLSALWWAARLSGSCTCIFHFTHHLLWYLKHVLTAETNLLLDIIFNAAAKLLEVKVNFMNMAFSLRSTIKSALGLSMALHPLQIYCL